MMSEKEQTTLSFEAALTELEELVARMEEDEISLEESLKYFERGVTLTKACQQALDDAEQKVQILTGEGAAASLEPFASE